VGRDVSGEIALRHGSAGLADDTSGAKFTARPARASGRSSPKADAGLEGDGKRLRRQGLSGGLLIVYLQDVKLPAGREHPDRNTALYGATSGEAFLQRHGRERFAVRNSGRNGGIEGLGDHGLRS